MKKKILRAEKSWMTVTSRWVVKRKERFEEIKLVF
jgi:hypothetical protein